MIRPPLKASSIALAAVFALHPATAQTSPPTDESSLPAVRAKASAEQEDAKGPVIGYAAKRSNTATKTDTPLNEVPQSISVITADQVKDQNSLTLQEVLRYAAGVRAETYGLDNRSDWFSVRGSDGSSLLDGLRLPLTGYYGIVRNEPYAFERIEVLRGPSSVIAGQNGPGGVINLVSKRPQAEALREVVLQVGNQDQKQISADLGGALNADASLQYRLVAVSKNGGTQVDHAYDKRQFIAPSLTWKPVAGTTLTAYAEYQKDRSGNTNAFFPVLGTLVPGPHSKIPYNTFIGEPDWDTYGGERTRVGYEVEQKLNEQWTLRHHLRRDSVEGKMRTLYAEWWTGFVDAAGQPDPRGEYLNRLWYFSDDTKRITNADLLLEGKLTFGNTRHTLLLGVDSMRSNAHQKYWGDFPATPLNVYKPVYGNFPMPALGEATESDSRVRQTGVLVQDQIKFDERWVLVAGLRHDKTDNGNKASATSRNLGLVWLGDGGWSPYASYSESFEPVDGTYADMVTRFKPKRGKQIEAGIKWVPANQDLTASAALYQLKETNRLTADADHPNFSVQRGTVTVKGLELEAAARLRAWDLVASYSFTDARQTRVSSEELRYLDKQLSSIPKHAAAIWALHKLGDYGLPAWKVGVGVRYSGKSTDGVDQVFTPAVTLTDLLVSYEQGPWRLALNVSNVADKVYIATCLERGDCWFGSSRRVALSAAYRW